MENYEGYKAGVRTIMRARDFAPGHEGRVLGILADVIEVAPPMNVPLKLSWPTNCNM
jgi:hypothetical protein